MKRLYVSVGVLLSAGRLTSNKQTCTKFRFSQLSGGVYACIACVPLHGVFSSLLQGPPPGLGGANPGFSPSSVSNVSTHSVRSAGAFSTESASSLSQVRTIIEF